MANTLTKRVVSYGSMGLLLAILSAISFALVHFKENCKNLDDYSQVQTYHGIAAIVGVVLFILSLLNFGRRMRDTIVILYIVCIAIAAVGALLLYTAHLEFYMPCNLSVKGVVNHANSLLKGERHNIFRAEDGTMIAAFVLDCIAALCAFGSSILNYLG